MTRLALLVVLSVWLAGVTDGLTLWDAGCLVVATPLPPILEIILVVMAFGCAGMSKLILEFK